MNDQWWNGFVCGLVVLVGAFVLGAMILAGVAANHSDKIAAGCGPCQKESVGTICGPYTCTFNDGWE